MELESQPSATSATLTSMTFGWVTLCIPLPLGWMPTWRKISLNADFGAKKL